MKKIHPAFSSRKIFFLTVLTMGICLTGRLNAQLYVTQAGTGGGSILKFNTDGSGQTTFASGLNINTYGLALDTSNNLYVAIFGSNNTTNSVMRYTPAGVGTTVVAASSTRPFAVAASSSNLYVGNYSSGVAANNGSVFSYNLDGTNGARIVPTSGNGLGTNTVAGLALDPTGAYLYVLNYANRGATLGGVGRYDLVAGTYNASFITGLSASEGIGVDFNGNIYVSTGTGGGATDVVLKFTSAGGNLASAVTFAGGLNDPYQIACDNTYLYVANYGAKAVGRYLLSDGTGSATWISGLTANPLGIAIVAAPEPSVGALLLGAGCCALFWRTAIRRKGKS